MKSICYTPVRGRVVRLTRLDGCGRPVYGEDGQVVSDGIVTVTMTANIDEGEEVNVPNFAGNRCVYEAAKPTFTGRTVQIDFCRVDPALFSLATGQEPVYNVDGEAIGFNEADDVDLTRTAFALEVWTGVQTTSDACAEDSEGEAVLSGYLLLPYLSGGVLGDITIENGAVTFSLTNAATKRGSGWGVGPYNVQRGTAGEATTLVGIGGAPDPIKAAQHLRNFVTDVPPPDPTCGSFPLLDPTDPVVTAITATGAADTWTFSPTPEGEDPMWYDFGDGTWDYAPTGTIDHVYETAGTFTVVGHRGASSASTDVVVTISS